MTIDTNRRNGQNDELTQTVAVEEGRAGHSTCDNKAHSNAFLQVSRTLRKNKLLSRSILYICRASQRAACGLIKSGSPAVLSRAWSTFESRLSSALETKGVFVVARILKTAAETKQTDMEAEVRQLKREWIDRE